MYLVVKTKNLESIASLFLLIHFVGINRAVEELNQFVFWGQNVGKGTIEI